MIYFFSISLSPPASITPIIEAPKIESPPAIKKIHNANPDNDSNPKPNNLICNLNCSQSSQCIQCSTKREPSPTTDTTHLIEDVRKLNIRTSNPDLSSSNLIKNNSPLASSSNLTITDPNDGLRLCSSNETLNKKSELKWQCFVSKCFIVVFLFVCLLIQFYSNKQKKTKEP